MVRNRPYFFSTWADWILSIDKIQPGYLNIRRSSYSTVIFRFLKRALLGILVFLGILNVVSFGRHVIVELFPDDLDNRLGAWDFSDNRLSIFSHWTTDGVTLSNCHSHNDYWRKIPLYSAIRAGCISVGVDIWLSDGDIVVGHNPPSLDHRVTLNTLYLRPLLEMIRRHNDYVKELQRSYENNVSLAGVFASDPSQSLTLLLDIKSDGYELWPHVMNQLQPLREAGYLTYFDGINLNQRPITIVASGNAPIDQIMANHTERDVFYDVPLDKLPLVSSNKRQPSADYNISNSHYASVDFRKAVGEIRHNRFSATQLALIREQIGIAHDYGLKVRYWGTPTWPRGLRNHVWHILVREGVDLINAEDLREATRQDWRKHRSWLL
ncbi:PLC-like phosphodiesterase [Talaromyces proteolyticus]|uniref:Altered inheritance of mitochondria protein 6 n=1 Tax=Talaromyces proteolyticus TaxID=1131652 RepID=A0AAD4L6D3_9EURO|nr:PLC-like phosphodiesterase [Talaromyces proteolyticus]KAH8705425.1 PLC-like phosphodiesterase [Talaromyces proteolyticus]